MIRSILEYAAPVWHPGVTIEQSILLESVQKRVFKIILPDHDYESALVSLKISNLKDRREHLTKSFFMKVKGHDDELNHVLKLVILTI